MSDIKLKLRRILFGGVHRKMGKNIRQTTAEYQAPNGLIHRESFQILSNPGEYPIVPLSGTRVELAAAKEQWTLRGRVAAERLVRPVPPINKGEIPTTDVPHCPHCKQPLSSPDAS